MTGGANSVVGDPAFVNPAADDYRLTAASAAINRGADVGVYTDFEGDVRPQGGGFDIGYDETAYTTDVAIVKTVAPAVVVPGGAITYTLSFSNTGTGLLSNVTISDTIPLSVTISGVTSSTFGSGVLITQTSGGPLPSVGGAFAWTVNKLAVGESGVITLTGTITASPAISLAGQIITNTAIITAAGDLTAGNNSSSAAPNRLCGPGTYLDTNNQCQPASSGEYVPDFGYTSALLCDLGYYQPNSGASSCQPAPVNTYVAVQGAAAPSPCPVGTYNPYEGSTSSTACSDLAAALTVRKTVDNPTPDFGAVITFTVAVSNSSSLSLTNASLTDSLPAGLTFVDGSASLTPPDGGATLAGDRRQPARPGRRVDHHRRRRGHGDLPGHGSCGHTKHSFDQYGGAEQQPDERALHRQREHQPGQWPLLRYA